MRAHRRTTGCGRGTQRTCRWACCISAPWATSPQRALSVRQCCSPCSLTPLRFRRSLRTTTAAGPVQHLPISNRLPAMDLLQAHACVPQLASEALADVCKSSKHAVPPCCELNVPIRLSFSAHTQRTAWPRVCRHHGDHPHGAAAAAAARGEALVHDYQSCLFCCSTQLPAAWQAFQQQSIRLFLLSELFTTSACIPGSKLP